MDEAVTAWRAAESAARMAKALAENVKELPGDLETVRYLRQEAKVAFERAAALAGPVILAAGRG